MYQLTYLSSALEKFTDDQLKELLLDARSKNSALQLSGMLLYIDGNFIQVLEGEEEIVKKVFETIRVDKRHTGILKLLGKNVDTRSFPDWSMGFKSLTLDEASDLSGYKNLNSETFKMATSENREHPALKLLQAFYKSNTRSK